MKYKIGNKVRVRQDLSQDSVAYPQRGLGRVITKIDPDSAFPYFVPIQGWADRMCWFWDDHLEYPPCEHKLRVCDCCDVVVCDECKREWGEPQFPEPNMPETYTYCAGGKRICCHKP